MFACLLLDARSSRALHVYSYNACALGTSDGHNAADVRRCLDLRWRPLQQLLIAVAAELELELGPTTDVPATRVRATVQLEYGRRVAQNQQPDQLLGTGAALPVRAYPALVRFKLPIVSQSAPCVIVEPAGAEALESAQRRVAQIGGKAREDGVVEDPCNLRPVLKTPSASDGSREQRDTRLSIRITRHLPLRSSHRR